MWFLQHKFGVTGVRCDRFEDDADVLRQRLVQALVPAGVKDAHRSGGQPNSHPEVPWMKPPSAEAPHLLDVAQLSLAQRVVVQLNAVGLVAGNSVQVCGLVVKHAPEFRIQLGFRPLQQWSSKPCRCGTLNKPSLVRVVCRLLQKLKTTRLVAESWYVRTPVDPAC